MASCEPLPVTSAICALTFSTGVRPAGYAWPHTGRHGAPPSSNRRQAADPRSVRNGSPPGISHATTIASPASVDARHDPVTWALSGTSAATGTSPGPTASPNDGGKPAGNPFGYGDGDGVVGKEEEAVDPVHAAAATRIAARKGRRIGAMVAVWDTSAGSVMSATGSGRVPGGTAKGVSRRVPPAALKTFCPFTVPRLRMGDTCT